MVERFAVGNSSRVAQRGRWRGWQWRGHDGDAAWSSVGLGCFVCAVAGYGSGHRCLQEVAMRSGPRAQWPVRVNGEAREVRSNPRRWRTARYIMTGRARWGCRHQRASG